MPKLVLRDEIAGFESVLSALGTPRRAEGEKRYLKSDLRFLGATTPDVRREVKAWLRDHPGVPFREATKYLPAPDQARLEWLRKTGL